MSIFFSILASISKTSGGISTPPSEPIPTSTSIEPVNSDFASTVWDKDYFDINKRSALSILKFYTNADSITVSFYSQTTGKGQSTEIGYMAVYDANWNYVGRTTAINNLNLQTDVVALTGSGYRNFYIVEGGTSSNGVYDFIGTYVETIAADTGFIGVSTPPSKTNRVIIVGDSISIGDSSSQHSRYAYLMRLRLQMPTWDFTSDGWGGAYHTGLVGTTTRQNEMVTRATNQFTGATGRKIMLWVLGTNDFGFVVGSPSDCALYAGNVWDGLYASDNQVEIICITPLWRGGQANANSGGWILQDYRDALTTASNSRSFVRVYDGEPILGVGDLISDQLHPTDGGHQKIADYVQSIL